MYKAQRDERFEYVWEVMHFIEENQCVDCVFKSDREEYPMCFEVEAQLLEEGPVEALDDRGRYGVVCTKYEQQIEREEPDPDQDPLF